MKSKSLFFIFLMVCLVFFLTGCDSGGGGSSSGGGNERTDDPYPNIEVEPFLPDGFTPNTLYKSDVEIGEETISGVDYVTKEISCVYLCSEGKFVASTTRIFINKSTNAVDDSKTEKKPNTKGSYSLTGNTSNGTLHATVTHEWDDDLIPPDWKDIPDEERNLPITNGAFTISVSGFSITYRLSH